MEKEKKSMDPEVKRAIKEFDKKARSAAMASAPIQAVMIDADEGKVGFDEWWMMLMQKIKLRPHMKEIVFADFKARNLTKKEKPEEYDKALKLFGIEY